MKHLQRFSNEDQYVATEDLQVSLVATNLKFHRAKPPTPITDIPVGFNLKGCKIYNSRLDLTWDGATGALSTENATVLGFGLMLGTLSYAGNQTGIQYFAGQGPGKNYIMYSQYGKNFSRGESLVPSDKDYIVKSNDLQPSTDPNVWGWQYVLVEIE